MFHTASKGELPFCGEQQLPTALLLKTDLVIPRVSTCRSNFYLKKFYGCPVNDNFPEYLLNVSAFFGFGQQEAVFMGENSESLTLMQMLKCDLFLVQRNHTVTVQCLTHVLRWIHNEAVLYIYNADIFTESCEI